MAYGRIASLNRYKTVGNEFLEHSEWIRKLRTPSLIGIASVLTIPFGIFIITPYVVMNISGPSALLSLLIAFIIMFLSGMHMNELMCSMPKSCLLYNFTYVSFGEIAAFLVGWISLLDFTICIVIVAKNWSSHMNLLFHGLFNKHFTVEMSYHLDSIFATKIDFFAVLAIFCSSIVLCCSIRVLATVSIIMVTICALATNSTAFVGFYFADPNNWLAAGFFKNGPIGVIKGASNYLCAYIGIETFSFLLEETKNPRKRLPFIMPFIITALTLVMFLTTMVITLATDISKYPDDMLFPNIFDKLEIPSAKYVMTIGSVCGLSGTMLAIFVPATRILTSLCGDSLLPLSLLAHTSKKRGVPYYAVLLCALLSSSMLLLNVSKLFEIIAFSTPLRLIMLGCLIYDQRYNPNVVGLFRETAFYRGIHRNRYNRHKTKSSNIFTDDGDSCSVTVSGYRWSTDDENSEMISSCEILRNIIIQQEVQCQQEVCENWMDKISSINENLGLLLNEEDEENEADQKLSERNLAKNSLTGLRYSTFNNLLAENLMEKTTKFYDDRKRLSMSSQDTYDFGHNCIRSPCSSCFSETEINKRKFHIFEHDIPKMPYWNKYPGSVSGSQDFDKTDHKRSMRTLFLFILSSVIIGLLILKTESSLTKPYLTLPMLLACITLVYLMINTARQTVNPVNNERNCKTPAFPHLTLLVIFLAILVACTTDCITVVGFIAWIITGMILYVLYGYKYSKEGRAPFNGLIIGNSLIKDNSSTRIMNNTSNHQFSVIML
ncbi:Amino acid permease family protein [Brugia pahangi]